MFSLHKCVLSAKSLVMRMKPFSSFLFLIFKIMNLFFFNGKSLLCLLFYDFFNSWLFYVIRNLLIDIVVTFLTCLTL